MSGYSVKVHETVANQVVRLLVAGNLPPWAKAWTNSPYGNPLNVISGKPYRGSNRWILSCYGYSDPRWATFKQIKSLGGTVKKGSKSAHITFFRPYVNKAGDEEYQVRRLYNVFNLEQTEGCKVKDLEMPMPVVTTIYQAEMIVSNMPNRPTIQHTDYANHSPYYDPTSDKVCVPSPGRYTSLPAYYNSMFHELAHSTGHPSRLSRPMAAFREDPHAYGLEELIAEMCAMMLNETCGIGSDTVEMGTAYINHWIRAIREDNTIIIRGGTQSQHAYDYITGVFK